MHILVLLLAAAFLNQAYAASELDAARVPATNFAFGAFDAQSCNLLCTGSVTAGNGFLSLTPEPLKLSAGYPKNQVGRVLYRQPVVAWPAFISTTFKFKIMGAPNSPAGDGMTFIFAPDNSPSPAGSTGFNLGIVPDSDGASVRQLAVELDTYKNDFDIDGNHISVDTISVDKPLITASLNSSGVDLKSGKDIVVQINYNSWTKWLEVYSSYLSDPPAKILSLHIDIAATIPNSVYVGFTAATGDFAESHQLLGWEFKSNTKPN